MNSQNIPPELWILITKFFCKDTSPRHLLTYSKTHALPRAACKFLLGKLDLSRRNIFRGRPIPQRPVFTIYGQRQEFAFLSTWARHLANEQIKWLVFKFDKNSLDEKTVYLSEILRLLRSRNNSISEIRLLYRAYLPSVPQAQGLFDAVAGIDEIHLDIHTKRRDGLPKFWWAEQDKCEWREKDSEQWKDEMSSFMPLASAHITDLCLEPYSLSSQRDSSAWISLSYPRLRHFHLAAHSPYVDCLHDFLTSHRRVSELTILLQQDRSRDPDHQNPPQFLRPSSTPISVHCPENLRMPDKWACSFLSMFGTGPYLESFYLYPTYNEPPARELDCMEYVGFVKSLFIYPRISLELGLLTSFHESAQHHQVESLYFLDTHEAVGSRFAGESVVLRDVYEVFTYVTYRAYSI